MYFSEDLIEEIRLQNDIVSVISGYVRLQRRGSNYFGLCPFHNEKSPSFCVNPGKQTYHCFGCGAGGSVFSFIMQYENYTFQEAVHLLADRGGISLPQEEYSEEVRRERDLKTSVMELNKTAAKFYYYQLRSPQGKRGMDYLKNRALSDETMKHFGLGYAGPDGTLLYRYLKKQGISDQLLKDSGLMQVNERQGMYDKFWNRVMFPIMDINHRVIGFGGRVMGDGKPKYLNSPETVVFDKGRNLYGLNFARSSREKYLLVCEGYMDVIALHQAGFTNSVASLGTALTSQHATILKRYTDEAILTYDSDEAGIRAALRAIPLLKEAGVSTRVLHMDPCKDPDEFIKAYGADAFRERISRAENSFLFELSVMEKSYDMKDPDGKTRFFQAVAAKIAGMELEIERENYIEAVVARYQTSYEGLRKMVLNTLMQGTPARTASRSTVEREHRERDRRGEKDSGILKSQRLILTRLVEYPALFATVSACIRPEDFSDGLYREVAAMLYGQLENNQVNPARIVNHFTEPEQQRQVAQIFNTDLPTETVGEQEKAIIDSIRLIIRHAMDQRKAALDPTDMKGLQDWMTESKKRQDDLKGLHISLPRGKE
ncbi:MAG: DNA primase [Lachnospiraceae bacterium]|nr:DNA primase [Lachnospiraceae bacterium]